MAQRNVADDDAVLWARTDELRVRVRFLTAAAMTAVAPVMTLVAYPAVAGADWLPTCATGQVQVSNGGKLAVPGYRGALLRFSLSDGGEPCTLTGYPMVDSGDGGPVITAEHEMEGVDGPAPPTVVLGPSHAVYAVVEGAAIDVLNADRVCPTYTSLQVVPPDTDDTFTVTAEITACSLEAYPVSA